LRGVGGGGGQDELGVRVHVGEGAQQVGEALLAGDAAHVQDKGAVRVDTEAADRVRVGRRVVEGGVDAVVDDVYPGRVDLGVGVQHVAAHPLAHRHDRRGTGA